MDISSAVTENDVSVCLELISRGADVNSMVGIKGYSLLHLAVWLDHQDVIRLLLEKGADVNIKDDKGETPLDYALYSGGRTGIKMVDSITPQTNSTIVKLLKQYGGQATN